MSPLSEKYTYYTYKITSPDSPCYYYGVSHVKILNATIEQCLQDGYFGSGGNSATNKFKTWRKEYSHIQKTVLKTFDTKQDAYQHEHELVGDRWKTDPHCLNSIPGGIYTGEHYIGPKVTEQYCLTHGIVKHLGATCCTCTAINSITDQECNIHGLTKFNGTSCRTCIVEDAITLQYCTVHGETKHIGTTCYRCRATKYTQQYCDYHGVTAHDVSNCVKCRIKKDITVEDCNYHGETQHMYGSCIVCKSFATVHILKCFRHGETKHRGTHCSTCVSQSTAHNIAHHETTHPDCWVCLQEIHEGIRLPAIISKVVQKVCELCNILYTPHHKNQIFCSNPHDWECAICQDVIRPTPRRGKTLYVCMKRYCRWNVKSLKTVDKS